MDAVVAIDRHGWDQQGEHADDRVALLLGTGKDAVESPMGDRALIRPGVIASGTTVAATHWLSSRREYLAVASGVLALEPPGL
jgi:hypothetical protein